jgi:hypothetical protein
VIPRVCAVLALARTEKDGRAVTIIARPISAALRGHLGRRSEQAAEFVQYPKTGDTCKPTEDLVGATRRRASAAADLAQGAEDFSPCLSTVRVLVVSIPAPRCDHRKGEAAALAEQFLMSVRIVLGHLFNPDHRV